MKHVILSTGRRYGKTSALRKAQMETLKAAITELDGKITQLEEERRDLSQQLWSLKFGLSIGDRVKYQQNFYEISTLTEYWPVGKKIRKNGIPSKQEVSLFRFEEMGEKVQIPAPKSVQKSAQEPPLEIKSPKPCPHCDGGSLILVESGKFPEDSNTHWQCRSCDGTFPL